MAILLFIGGTIGIIGFEASFFVGLFSNLDDVLELPAFVVAIIVIVLTEWLLIRERAHYRTGLLQAAYLHAIQLVIAAVSIITDGQEFVVTFMAMMLCFVAVVRYMDRFALAAAYLSLSAFIFLLFDSLDGPLVFFVPLLLSSIFAGIAFISNRMSESRAYWLYGDLLSASKLFALILMSLSVNVLVVSTSAKDLMGLSGELPLSWLFIILSVGLPLLMMISGWNRRDRVLLDIGAVGVCLGIYSIKLYFELPTNEFVLAFVGLSLVTAAILLIRFFDKGIDGITSKKEIGDASTLLKVLEAAHAFDQGDNKPDNLMGGGNFGGGGSQSNF